jgi:hypothetical protein
VSKLKYPEWQTPYQEALLESDKKKLEAKIHLTEWRIFRRLQTISADSNHQDEKVAIADALNKLRSLKSNSMKLPRFESPLRGKFLDSLWGRSS